MKAIKVSAPMKAIGIKLSAEKSAAAKKVITELGGEFILADDNCGNSQIGALFGFRGFEMPSENSPAESELLIFSGFDGKALNKAVTQLRENDCVITLKAMVTAHNQSWTVNRLAAELANEHQYMNSRGGKRDGNE